MEKEKYYRAIGNKILSVERTETGNIKSIMFILILLVGHYRNKVKLVKIMLIGY